MRNLIIMVVLMLGVSTMTTFAQSAKSVQYKAGYAEITYDEDWVEAEVFDIADQGVIITASAIDDYSSKIDITNQFKDSFIYSNEEVSKEMVDGHERSTYMYDAVDKDGVDLIFLVQNYDDGHLFGERYRVRFRFCYKNVWYGYYCNVKGEIGNKNMDVDPKPTTTPGSKNI